MQEPGKYIFIAGVVIALAGLIIWLFGNKFSWFGSLPGDIRIEKENFRFYAPVVSMLLVSIVLSVVVWLIRKFL